MAYVDLQLPVQVEDLPFPTQCEEDVLVSILSFFLGGGYVAFIPTMHVTFYFNIFFISQAQQLAVQPVVADPGPFLVNAQVSNLKHFREFDLLGNTKKNNNTSISLSLQAQPAVERMVPNGEAVVPVQEPWRSPLRVTIILYYNFKGNTQQMGSQGRLIDLSLCCVILFKFF